jgi:hypothetical protein
MSIEYKVPRLLWENLESVLLAQSKRYISELAKRLQVSEKELQKRVLPSSDVLKIIIQDTQSETNQCKAYIQNGKLTIFCRKPVAFGCDYCSFHRHKRMTIVDNTHPLHIQKLKDNNTVGSLWIHNNIIYNSVGEISGKLNRKNNKIKIFVEET